MATSKARKKEGGWRETLSTVVWALVIAAVFKSLLFQPFSIPSGSMKPSLLVGDYLFVSKFAYGYSRYSFPYSLDLFEGRIWADEPERGDIVVFKHPRQDACAGNILEKTWGFFAAVFGQRSSATADCVDYVKRIVGLPGDRIQMKAGVLHINDEPVPMTRIGDYVEPNERRGSPPRPPRCSNAPVRPGGECIKELWSETLPGGVEHEVLNVTGEIGNMETNGRLGEDTTAAFEVPEGHYFFMGDNRDNSVDSRFPAVGFVPFEKLIGRADIVVISSDGAFWEVWKWRWSRMLELI